MNSSEQLVHLIVVEESPNEAEKYVSMLRNAGYALRLNRVEDDEDFREALNQQDYDLILCAEKLSFIDAPKALDILKSSKQPCPLLVMVEAASRDAYISLLRAGARDVVLKDDKEQLQLVARRELESLRQRRALAKSETSLSECERRSRALLDSSRDAIVYVHDGMHVYANESYLELFGYQSYEDLEGIPIMDMIDGDFQEEFKNSLKRKNLAHDIAGTPLELECLSIDGAKIQVTAEFSNAHISGEPCTQVIFRDRSNSKELEEKLQALSNNDPLTGLFNRQYFQEQLENLMRGKPKSGQYQSLMYIVIDDFHTIAERVGISGVDVVIRATTDLLKSALGKDALLARLSEHSFATLVKSQTESDLETLAGKVSNSVADHLIEVSDQRSVSQTCSIGAVQIQPDMENAHEVLKRADLALKRATGQGGGSIHIYNELEDAPGTSAEDKEWMRKVANALRENNFQLVYQPIVSLGGSDEQNYGVYLRLRDPEQNNKLCSPGEFMGAATHAGLMPAIDRWVVEDALKAIADEVELGKSTGLFVKVSLESMRDTTFLAWLSELVRNHAAPAERLTVEITESSLVDYFKESKQFIQGLTDLGAHVALTHVGSGKGTLNYLKQIKVDYVKFSKEFLSNLAKDTAKQEQLRTMTAELHNSSIKSIVEFVENSESLAVLWQSGVDFLQGYFLQEPAQTLSFDFTEEAL